MHMNNNQLNKKYIRIWRIFLGLLAVSLITVIIYGEAKTTVTYTYQPNSNNNWIKKKDTSPNESPLIWQNNQKVLLVNLPETTFNLPLTDIFESITIKVYYQSTAPQKLIIRTKNSRSLPMLDTTQISIYNELNDPAWKWESKTILSSEQVYFYEKPSLPKNFPPLEKFLDASTINRVRQNAEVFIVKNDQNIDYESITEDFDLPFIAYVLAPNLDAIEYIDLSSQKGSQTYTITLMENLDEAARQRGVNYRFDLRLQNYRANDWAIVRKIEILAKRNPITLTSLKEYLQKIFPF